MTEARVPFPFIVGSPRSGTTLLRLMLGSHPSMAIPGEAQFLVPLAKGRRRYEASPFGIDQLVHDLGKRAEFRRWKLPEDEVLAALRAGSPGDLAQAMRLLYALQAARHGKARYGDKTPRNVYSMPFIKDLFPEACFVHVIRDGRDVASSLVDMKWFSGDLTDAALRWKRSVLAGRSAGAHLGSDHYLEIRYEDLLEDPERVLDPVCRFTSLSFDPSMLDHRARLTEDFRPPQGSLQHQHLALPATKGLRDWRRDMTPQQLAMVEASIGDTLDDLGYERGSQQISLGVRTRARVRASSDRIRTLARRLTTTEVVG